MADTSSERLMTEYPFEEMSEDNTNGKNKESGMNVWQTALSIAGYSAGFAFLAVDVFVVSTGWVGMLLFFVLYAMIFYSTILIGRCFNMVRVRASMERHPYGVIGYEAYGGPLRSFINFLVSIIAFSSAIGLQLAFAETTLIVGGPALVGTFCYWPLLYGIVLCPLMWLASPKDFWWISAASYFTVVLAVIFIIFAVFLGESPPANLGSDVDGVARETALFHLTQMVGMLMWTRGLHYVFPTVQQDMKEPQSFSKAVMRSDSMLLPIVLPVILVLFIVYGDTLSKVTGDVTVLSLLSESALKRVSAILILVHLTGPILAANNPLFQYLEEVFDVPSHFTWKRAALRSTVLLIQVFIQESVPHVMIVGSVTGGFLMPILNFVLPSLCYLRLRKNPAFHSPRTHSTKGDVLDTIGCYCLLAAAPCLAASVIYVTVSQIVMGRTVFSVPCYINATRAHA